MFSAVTPPDFKIVDETAEYIVVDKPAFLLTHPTKPDQRTTLWKELRELLAFEIANGGQVSIVNRLDRETSGLVLVAKTSAEPSPPSSPSGKESREAAGDGATDKFALIHAIPKTGRTHQIRVHLASLGYPVVGDKIYGPNEQLYLEFIETGWTPKLERELLLPRHALQSSKLAIENEHEWTSQLPTELAWFVDNSL